MTAYANTEGSGSYRVPPSRLDDFERRLAQVERGMTEVRWLLRAAVALGLLRYAGPLLPFLGG